jgi:hypothetical protein
MQILNIKKMKQELHEIKTNCQTRLDILNDKSRKLNVLFSIPSNDGISDIFLIRNKGKGPPGRTKDSGMASSLIRNDELLSFRALHPEPGEVCKTPIENELITHINKSKFLSQLNFIIMKKQIQILAFFILASWAGIMTSFGQDQDHLTTALSTCPAVTAVTCLSNDALHPVPGTPYTYTVTVPTPAGTPTYNWFVTQDQEFVKASAIFAVPEVATGAGLHVAATGTGYNDPITGKANIDITWKAFTHDPTKPVFLVIYVKNPATCSNDNMQVYIIQPVHAFTLDLANVDLVGATHATDFDGPCAAPVASAKYDQASQKVLMNYGINYLYFAVTAANYTGAWKPSFKITGATITGTAGDRAVTAVDWTYPTTSTSVLATDWHTAPLSGTDFVSTDVVKAQAASKTVGIGGECIVVRVTVDNGRMETLAKDPISFAVDGVTMTESTVGSGTYDTVGLGDIHSVADGAGVCPWFDGFTNDVVVQNIMPRPDIQTATPGVAPNPNPGTFIPKN